MPNYYLYILLLFLLIDTMYHFQFLFLYIYTISKTSINTIDLYSSQFWYDSRKCNPNKKIFRPWSTFDLCCAYLIRDMSLKSEFMYEADQKETLYIYIYVIPNYINKAYIKKCRALKLDYFICFSRRLE